MTRLRYRALHVALLACLAIAFALAAIPARASRQRLCPVKDVPLAPIAKADFKFCTQTPDIA